jgi:hypothetical protein
MLYKCVDERYDNNGSNTYTLDDFLKMCEHRFDEKPKLFERGSSYAEWTAPDWWQGTLSDALSRGLASAHIVLVPHKEE